MILGCDKWKATYSSSSSEPLGRETSSSSSSFFLLRPDMLSREFLGYQLDKIRWAKGSFGSISQRREGWWEGRREKKRLRGKGSFGGGGRAIAGSYSKKVRTLVKGREESWVRGCGEETRREELGSGLGRNIDAKGGEADNGQQGGGGSFSSSHGSLPLCAHGSAHSEEASLRIREVGGALVNLRQHHHVSMVCVPSGRARKTETTQKQGRTVWFPEDATTAANPRRLCHRECDSQLPAVSSVLPSMAGETIMVWRSDLDSARAFETSFKGPKRKFLGARTSLSKGQRHPFRTL
ncbi:hypothetical protein V8F33_004810 [Rhypophila sp. PSN 637]